MLLYNNQDILNTKANYEITYILKNKDIIDISIFYFNNLVSKIILFIFFLYFIFLIYEILFFISTQYY